VPATRPARARRRPYEWLHVLRLKNAWHGPVVAPRIRVDNKTRPQTKKEIRSRRLWVPLGPNVLLVSQAKPDHAPGIAPNLRIPN